MWRLLPSILGGLVHVHSQVESFDNEQFSFSSINIYKDLLFTILPIEFN